MKSNRRRRHRSHAFPSAQPREENRRDDEDVDEAAQHAADDRSRDRLHHFRPGMMAPPVGTRIANAASTLAQSLDILHVAAALTLGARVFVSFDDRQRKLARRARLKVLPRIRPSAVQP